MSYEHLRGVMASAPHATFDSPPAALARPHLTVVPDPPVAFEPEPVPLPIPDQWQDRALCAQTDPEAFFPEKGGSTREAKRICLSCEVRSVCLLYCLDNVVRFGLLCWLSLRLRRRLLRGFI